MTERPAEVDAAIRAHRRLDEVVAGLDDEQARQPSLLPGWSVGHVLTHLARNADGLARMVDGAARGEVVDMYVGGLAGRDAEIEAGCARPASELVADAHEAALRLEEAWAASDWTGSGRTFRGEEPITETPGRRWREVAVHTVDLGLGYGWDDLPDDFIRSDLPRMTMLYAARKPMGLAELPAAALAAPPRLRLAWLLGRAEIAGLEPASIF